MTRFPQIRRRESTRCAVSPGTAHRSDQRGGKAFVRCRLTGSDRASASPCPARSHAAHLARVAAYLALDLPPQPGCSASTSSPPLRHAGEQRGKQARTLAHGGGFTASMKSRTARYVGLVSTPPLLPRSQRAIDTPQAQEAKPLATRISGKDRRRMWLLDKMLKRLVQAGRLVVTDHDGTRYEYGPGAASAIGTDDFAHQQIHVRLTDKRAARHIATYPQVGAGEAFMRGWLVVEPPHDIRDFVLFATGHAKAHGERALQPQTPLKRLIQKLAAKADSLNPRGKARNNAEHTYNLTRRLYELFLDEDRQYTMAYYRDPENSLEKAQLDKKAHIAAKLYMHSADQRPGGKPLRVLDIGSGWGGFALYLNKHYGAEVLGVALAPDQIAFCKERAEAEGVADKVRFELMDYRDVTGTFDRISSVGLLEHVGTPQYPGFFEHTHKLLAPDGVMVSHCCGRAGPPGFTDAWTRKYIFPGGYIPALSELVTQSERAGFQVMDVEAMRFHYSLTLEEWYKRTVLHREEITRLYDERFYRMWLFYLAGAEQSFRHGTLVNWQLQYVKDRAAIPMTREYIGEESARLRASDEPPAWHLDPALREAAE